MDKKTLKLELIQAQEIIKQLVVLLEKEREQKEVCQFKLDSINYVLTAKVKDVDTGKIVENE